ncbi:MAG: GGDEF domain-containing protein [Candidatus Acidiferrales bacterium]
MLDGHVEIENDIGLSCFAGGSASAYVEVMQRRKYWDGEVGLSPFIEAFRQAIREWDNAEETDFQDDGDFIFLHYEITIPEDSEIQNAISRMEEVINEIEERTEQLVRRRLDPLLGIYDRGSFDSDLAHALRHSRAGVGLVLGDIDRFKKINDERGHQQGDAVLSAIAKAFAAQSARIGAAAYRYGGEELAAIRTSVNRDGLLAFAESVRHEVEKLTFENVPQLRVTISLGVALAPRDGNNPEQLLKKAESELYIAQHNRLSRAKSAN